MRMSLRNGQSTHKRLSASDSHVREIVRRCSANASALIQHELTILVLVKPPDSGRFDQAGLGTKQHSRSGSYKPIGHRSRRGEALQCWAPNRSVARCISASNSLLYRRRISERV